MRTSAAYEVIDARQIENQSRLEPLGILRVVQNEVSVNGPGGRAEHFEISDETFEDEDDEVTIHTPTGPVFCRQLHQGSEAFREYATEGEELDLADLYLSCVMAQR
jgi:hypothetical protein